MNNDFRAKYLRQLPSIGKLIERPELSDLSNHSIVVQCLREIIDSRKSLILSAKSERQLADLDLSSEKIISEAKILINKKFRMNNRYAINATGDVLHEKLGRSPLNESAQKAIKDVIKGYSVSSDISELLSSRTGAESGLVVNNGTAGLMLALNTVCNGKETIISRGELVDDDARLPEIIELSGARLVSVGTTNKTHIRDYVEAIGENTGAILRANRSNFRIVGFTEQVGLGDLVTLAKESNPPNPLWQRGNNGEGSQRVNSGEDLQKGDDLGLPVIDYIINGCFIDLTQLGFPEEPYVPLSIKTGADIVCFNGNRLFGGSQAGLVVGKEKYISAMLENPLYDALKPNKMTISALEGTLRSYIDTDKILENSLALTFLSRSYDEIAYMAMSLFDKLRDSLGDFVDIKLRDGYSIIESLAITPEKFLTKLIVIEPAKISSDELANRLSMRDVPIFVMSDEGHITIDLRAVWIDEIDEIATALIECFQSSESL